LVKITEVENKVKSCQNPSHMEEEQSKKLP
jgi:hypothetical protein